MSEDAKEAQADYRREVKARTVKCGNCNGTGMIYGGSCAMCQGYGAVEPDDDEDGGE